MGLRVVVVVAATGLGVLTACTGDESSEVWCGVVAELPESYERSLRVEVEGSPTEIRAMVAEMEGNIASLVDDAPPSIRDEAARFVEFASGQSDVDEAEVEDDRNTLNDYIRDKCDLDIEL